MSDKKNSIKPDLSKLGLNECIVPNNEISGLVNFIKGWTPSTTKGKKKNNVVESIQNPV